MSKIQITVRDVAEGKSDTFTIYKLPRSRVSQIMRDAVRKAAPTCFEKPKEVRP